MNIQRLAAFSNGNSGGNPAGVVIADAMPAADEMQRVAHSVGFSETAFAAPDGESWRVRYFSPQTEVPFCGHATIALGAALAMREGDGTFALQLNGGDITVEGRRDGDLYAAALQSPPTRSAIAAVAIANEALELFGLSRSDLDERAPIARIHAGADHLVILLKHRAALASMQYAFARGQALMTREGWVTVLLGYAETAQRFHTRNAFAFGGVYEDPATGASTAALAGYLRDLGWPHGGRIDVHQGDDMGVPSRLTAEIGGSKGGSIRVSGTARVI